MAELKFYVNLWTLDFNKAGKYTETTLMKIYRNFCICKYLIIFVNKKVLVT